MIRVNLLQSHTTATQAPAGTSAATNTAMSGGRGRSLDFSPDILVKLVIIFIPVAAIVSYDYYMAGQRQRALAQVTAQLADAKQKLESLKPQVEAVTKFQENKGQLQKKIDVIRTISRERLKNVKALDALQTIIPAKVWLQHLAIKDNKAVMEGTAVEDLEVSKFMKDLEESIFFQNVQLKSVTSDKSKEGVLKKFALEAFLENM